MINLLATTFSDLMATTYGFRMYDEYDQCYDDNSESPIEDDLDLLRYALTVDCDKVREMLSYLKENREGMNINNVWYDWDEIAAVFN
jgi:hypothetical protein